MSEVSLGQPLESMGELKLLAETGAPHGTIYELIEKSGFFSGLDRDEIEMLAVWVKAYSAPMGTLILREGDEQANLCIIVEGQINIFKEASANEHLKIAEARAGDSIGEMGVVDGYPLSATAVASTDSIILFISRTDFEHLLQKNSNLGVKILLKIAKIISLRLRHTTKRLAALLASKGR